MSRAQQILEHHDFSGWATRSNLRCSDGRTIMEGAFAHNDGKIVPLVWMHNHDDPSKVLGHCLLKKEKGGMKGYGVFNNTEAGQYAKELVHSGDIVDLSIYANQLQQKAISNGVAVMHGDIKEVSLVLAGANPGAHIDSEIVHGEYSDESAFIVTGEGIELFHSDDDTKKGENEMKEDTNKKNGNENDDETIADVFETLTEKQKTAVYAIVGAALEDNDTDEEDDSKGGNDSMKHNAFENDDNTVQRNTLSHADMENILRDAKRCGSLKEAFLAHAEDDDIDIDHKVTATYGIDRIDYLFPDAKNVTNQPVFIKRDTSWVSGIINGAHHTPFSRIKSVFANITEDEARAKGYIKGKMKKEEVFTLLKRSTTPQTVYKKQKMDRDDIIDITDFDVVAWLKSEMRIMLDEELARAALIGDGRHPSDDDHIKEDNIRPIWKDADLFTIKRAISVNNQMDSAAVAKEFIKECIRSRKNYKGSGNPTLYTTEDMLTEMLLLTDETGRDLYDSVEKLATKLRVKNIVTVPVMENQTRESGNDTLTLAGIIVNIGDYTFGADKGGSVNMFDDFDIDYNQQKYLIETRCSGALTLPYSAIVIETKTA